MSTLFTRHAMRVRVRRLFLEEEPSVSTDFIDQTLVPDEIDQAYDESCHAQLSTVTMWAEQQGLLEDHGNPFFEQYQKVDPVNILAGYSDYHLPSDMLRPLRFDIDGLRATRVPPAMDPQIRKWPSQFGPAKGEVMWCILPTSTAASPPVLINSHRVYVYGNGTVPMNTMSGRFYFLRKVIPIAYDSPPASYVDCQDPWNDGPCHWSCALLQEKAGLLDRAVLNRQLAMEAFARIVSPPPPPAGAKA